MKQTAVFAMLLAGVLASKGYAAPVQVVSDMTGAAGLVDGDPATTALGKAGTNKIVLQFGQNRYVASVKMTSASVLDFAGVEIYVSDDFVDWTKVYSGGAFRGKVFEAPFTDVSTPFMKIVIVSRAAFGLGEVECLAGRVPSNRITDVRVGNLSETSATITWKTAVKTIDYLYFMKKHNGTEQTMVQANYVTNHSVVLGGLLRGSEYTYRIVSESPDGTRIESGELSFTTRGVPLPEFWELRALNISPFDARISFTANVPVRYEVYLGSSADNLVKVIEENGYDSKREFTLQGLQPEKHYFYKLVIQDKQGAVLMTTPLDFFTPVHNLALGKRIWGTFGCADPDAQFGTGRATGDARIVDGDLNYFTGSAVSFNADNAAQYVIIDLGREYQFKSVDVYWWGLAYSRDYRVEISHDGFVWKTLRDHLDAERGEEMRSPAGDLLVYQSVKAVETARFVRVYMEAGSKRGTRAAMYGELPYFRLCEIAVIENL